MLVHSGLEIQIFALGSLRHCVTYSPYWFASTRRYRSLLTTHSGSLIPVSGNGSLLDGDTKLRLWFALAFLLQVTFMAHLATLLQIVGYGSLWHRVRVICLGSLDSFDTGRIH